MPPSSSISSKLLELIERNATVQLEKSKGGFHWIYAVILALGSLVILYFARRDAKKYAQELQEAKTTLETDAIETASKLYQKELEKKQTQYNVLQKELDEVAEVYNKNLNIIKKEEASLKETLKLLDKVTTWEELNDF